MTDQPILSPADVEAAMKAWTLSDEAIVVWVEGRACKAIQNIADRLGFTLGYRTVTMPHIDRTLISLTPDSR